MLWPSPIQATKPFLLTMKSRPSYCLSWTNLEGEREREEEKVREEGRGKRRERERERKREREKEKEREGEGEREMGVTFLWVLRLAEVV